MTPTTWISLTAFCGMLGLIINTFSRSISAGAYFGRMTTAMENIDKNLAAVLVEVKEHTQKLVEHDLRIFNLEKDRNPDRLDFARRRGRTGNDS